MINEKFGQRFTELIQEKGLTQKYIAKFLNVSQPQVHDYKHGSTPNKEETLIKLCKLLGVTRSYILGENDSRNIVYVPILGKIRAGLPIFASENYSGEYTFSDNMTMNKDCFVLEVIGDSMCDSNIKDGDSVIFEKQDFLEKSGDIMAVLIDDEATIKRVTVNQDSYILLPSNKKYDPIIVNKNSNIKFLGKLFMIISRATD